jgi:hypothetical protein
MENLIKNIHLIENEAIVSDLNISAQSHKRFSRIYFKIKSLKENKLIVLVYQEKSPQENYADVKRLIEIGVETFGRHFDSLIIDVEPFKPVESEIVTPEWIVSNMNRLKIKLKKIANDTGIGNADISAIINKHKPLSIRTKSLFYYYFKCVELSAFEK